jgi:hypothetical protein
MENVRQSSDLANNSEFFERRLRGESLERYVFSNESRFVAVHSDYEGN